MNEATKTKLIYGALFEPYLNGKILDIGAGKDPITKNADVFDKEQGNAQNIGEYLPSNSFDTVFSSHCLEHMHDPKTALFSWLELVKPGGYLIILVPDEDLYEQGHFPSKFNSDHKATFTISKANSWSHNSINCLDLCTSLSAEIVYLSEQSDNYDYKLQTHKKNGILRFPLIRHTLRLKVLAKLFRRLKLLPIDQTSTGKNVLAQICFILKKSN